MVQSSKGGSLTMATTFTQILEHNPKLPTLLANIAVGKIIHSIDSKMIDPFFDQESIARRVGTWPNSIKKTVEWSLHLLSGIVRTLPEKHSPVSIIIREALAETLTHSGIKISEIPETEQQEIMTLTLPVMRRELANKVSCDHKLRNLFGSIVGTTQEWNNIIQEADNFLSQKRREIETHRQIRKNRGWRRFFV